MQFSQEQAAEICEDFEDLKDTEFALGGVDYIVNDIMACPIAPAERDAFFTEIVSGNCEAYPGEPCGVVLYVEDAVSGSLHFVDILAYIEEKGVTYNFPS